MKLYNTFGRKIEELKPLSDKEVKLYTCGPTVYDYAQLGNLRAFVFDDTLRRVLQSKGYNVRHVMNVTDVGHLVSDDDEGEDKLEKGAGREQKTVSEVANFYIKAFLEDAKKLNILQPNAYQGPHGNYARASDFIDEQTAIIKILLDKGFAYKTEQAIYFDVSKLDDYGKLTGQKLSDKEVAARSEVVTDTDKRNPQDFALWFFIVGRFENHSLHWPSPWGEGFPGWHLECSAIIHATLGEPIDIHTGGVDHIGTHHTNEIAQTEAAFGVKLANYWVHNEHLLVDGRKMSKSQGNYFILKDLTDKGYDPLALRVLFLQSHYRSQANFTWDSLDAAASYLKRLQAWADLRFQRQPKLGAKDLQKVKDAAANDLNTPEALAVLSGVIEDTVPELAALEQLDNMLGLNLAERTDLSTEIKSLIARRQEARDKKSWSESDRLREELAAEGVEVNDSAGGPIWRRI